MADRFWAKLPLDTLKTIQRIAKDKDKGLRPFFADPREMIALRNYVSEQELSK